MAAIQQFCACCFAVFLKIILINGTETFWDGMEYLTLGVGAHVADG